MTMTAIVMESEKAFPDSNSPQHEMQQKKNANNLGKKKTVREKIVSPA